MDQPHPRFLVTSLLEMTDGRNRSINRSGPDRAPGAPYANRAKCGKL